MKCKEKNKRENAWLCILSFIFAIVYCINKLLQTARGGQTACL